MGNLVHIRLIVQHPQWRHHPVNNIQLVLCVFLSLMLVMVVVKVVWDLVPLTLPPIKLVFGLMVYILCDIRVGNIHPWVFHTNEGHIIHHILLGSIIVILLVMVEVILVLGQPTYTNKNMILAETGIMGFFRNIIISTQHPSWWYLEVGIFQFLLLMVICFVLMLEMVKLVWVLVPPNLPPKKLIVVLMVKNLCHKGVDNIHTWVLNKKTGTILHKGWLKMQIKITINFKLLK